MLFSTGTFVACAIILFLMGFIGLIFLSHPIRKILAVNIASSGLFMFFLTLSQRDLPLGLDPVPHAMVLTGIVVSVAFSALALRLAVNSRKDEPSSP